MEGVGVLERGGVRIELDLDTIGSKVTNACWDGPGKLAS